MSNEGWGEDVLARESYVRGVVDTHIALSQMFVMLAANPDTSSEAQMCATRASSMILSALEFARQSGEL